MNQTYLPGINASKVLMVQQMSQHSYWENSVECYLFQNTKQKCNDTFELNVECYRLHRIFKKRVALGNKWTRDISQSFPILCKHKIHANQNLKSFICIYLYSILNNSHESKNNEIIAFILHAKFKKYITTSNHYFKSPSLGEAHKSYCIHEHFFFFVGVFCTEARSNCIDNHKG